MLQAELLKAFTDFIVYEKRNVIECKVCKTLSTFFMWQSDVREKQSA